MRAGESNTGPSWGGLPFPPFCRLCCCCVAAQNNKPRPHPHPHLPTPTHPRPTFVPSCRLMTRASSRWSTGELPVFVRFMPTNSSLLWVLALCSPSSFASFPYVNLHVPSVCAWHCPHAPSLCSAWKAERLAVLQLSSCPSCMLGCARRLSQARSPCCHTLDGAPITVPCCAVLWPQPPKFYPPQPPIHSQEDVPLVPLRALDRGPRDDRGGGAKGAGWGGVAL